MLQSITFILADNRLFCKYKHSFATCKYSSSTIELWLCSAMVYYWIQFLVMIHQLQNIGSAKHHLVTIQKINAAVSFGSTYCQKGLMFYNTTCYIINVLNLSSFLNPCDAERMRMIQIPEDLSHWSILSLTRILANCNVHTVQLSLRDRKCLRMKPTSLVCHPDSWDIILETGCTYDTKYFVICETYL